MSDPKRLSFQCESDFEQMLLRAGRAEAPAAAKQRALLAVSAGLVIASVPAGVAGQSAVAAKAGAVITLKWLAVIGVAAVGAVVTAVGVRAAHRSEGAATVAVNAAASGFGESMPAASVPTTTAAAPPATESLAVVTIASAAAVPPAGLPRAVARAVPRSAESSASSASALPVELAILERARSAMGAGDTRRALFDLDTYAARFPRGTMAPEAAVLRVEALMKAGDRSGAMRFAHTFLAGAPHSPYAARIQTLLSASNP